MLSRPRRWPASDAHQGRGAAGRERTRGTRSRHARSASTARPSAAPSAATTITRPSRTRSHRVASVPRCAPSVEFNVVPAIPDAASRRSPSWPPTSTGRGTARRQALFDAARPGGRGGRSGHDPLRLIAGDHRRAAGTGSPPTRRSSTSTARRRADRTARRDHDVAALVPGRPRRLAARTRRLLLARVRHHRGAAAVLRRPRRPRRRPPQGGVRPRRAARRRRPALRRGLLPPAAQRRRLAGGALPPPRPARPGARRRRACRSPSTSPATPCTVDVLAGRRSAGSRCTCSTPTSTATAPRASPSPTASTAATPSTASARRSCSASAACARCGPSACDPQVFHTNEGHAGFLGLERIRELVAGRADVRRGDRGGARRRRVHHPHAGAGRHRPLPAATDGEVLRARSPPSAASTFDELMALGRRADEPDDNRFNMAVMGLRLAGRSQRRRRAARRGQPGDVPGAVARRARRRGADRLDHQRRPRPHVGQRRVSTTLLAATSVGGMWDGADEAAWAARRRALHPRRGVGRPCAPAAPALVRVRARRPRRRRARPGRADDRLRPPLRHLQAGDAAAVAARAAAARCCSTTDRPVQFVFAGKAHPADEPGKEMIREIELLRPRARRAPPLRVPPGLRHRGRPDDVPRLRRVAEQPAPPAGGVRHERDEGGAQRRAQLLILDGWWDECYDGDERLGDRVGRRRPGRRAPRRSARRPACSTCSRTRDRAAVLRPQRRRRAASAGSTR